MGELVVFVVFRRLGFHHLTGKFAGRALQLGLFIGQCKLEHQRHC